VLLLDLFPTLLDLIDVTAPVPLDGISVADHLREDAPLPRRRFVAEASSELRWTYDGPDTTWQPPWYAAVDPPWKLIRTRRANSHGYELYNVERDPKELRNLYSEPDPESQSIARELRDHVDAYAGLCDQRRAALLSQSNGSTPASPTGEIDDERLLKLRTLGYIE
jgi:arylsulfatase A-like enzyme